MDLILVPQFPQDFVVDITLPPFEPDGIEGPFPLPVLLLCDDRKARTMITITTIIIPIGMGSSQAIDSKYSTLWL